MKTIVGSAWPRTHQIIVESQGAAIETNDGESFGRCSKSGKQML